MELYEDAIAKGITKASTGLANLLSSGAPAIERDAERANAIYEDIIANGNTDENLYAKFGLAKF